MSTGGSGDLDVLSRREVVQRYEQARVERRIRIDLEGAGDGLSWNAVDHTGQLGGESS